MLTDARQALLQEQRQIIHTLVTEFGERPDRLEPMFAEDFASAPDDNARLRVVVDQVASLTDHRARALAEQLP